MRLPVSASAACCRLAAARLRLALRLCGEAWKCCEALAVIDEAIAKAEQNKESFFSLAEFWRIKGEILLSASGSNVLAADGCFLRAIEQASRQGALSWELRAATSLARSHVRQNRLDEARSVLTPLYDRFTEGFDSCDLRAARSLLDKIEHLQTAAE